MSNYKGVFNQQIRQFFYNDLDSALKVSKIKQGLFDFDVHFEGGLNFTSALAIFSVIDMMAGYYKGVLQTNMEDIIDFIYKYFKKHNSLFTDKEFIKRFYEVFRHGLVHTWSPKAGGVAMDFTSDKVIDFDNIGKEKIPILNVPAFYELTKKALNDYEMDLENGNYVNSFEKRYKLIIKRDYSEMRELVKLLEKNK